MPGSLRHLRQHGSSSNLRSQSGSRLRLDSDGRSVKSMGVRFASDGEHGADALEGSDAGSAWGQHSVDGGHPSAGRAHGESMPGGGPEGTSRPSAQQAVLSGLDAIEEAEAREDSDYLQQAGGPHGSIMGAAGQPELSLSTPPLQDAEESYRLEAMATGSSRRRSRTTPAAPDWFAGAQSLLGTAGSLGGGQMGASAGLGAQSSGGARQQAQESLAGDDTGQGQGPAAGPWGSTNRQRSLTGLSALSSMPGSSPSQFSVATAPQTAGAIFSFSAALAAEQAGSVDRSRLSSDGG